MNRATQLGQEGPGFKDVLCQLCDYLNPIDPLCITLNDLIKPDKRTIGGLFFDVLFNFHKFMRFELRDPFQEKLRREDGFTNDWNRYDSQLHFFMNSFLISSSSSIKVLFLMNSIYVVFSYYL